MHRRRVFDCRHGELSVDQAGTPAAEHRRFLALEALAGGDPCAPGDGARVCQGEGSQSIACTRADGGGEQDSVRAEQGQRALMPRVHTGTPTMIEVAPPVVTIRSSRNPPEASKAS